MHIDKLCSLMDLRTVVVQRVFAANASSGEDRNPPPFPPYEQDMIENRQAASRFRCQPAVLGVAIIWAAVILAAAGVTDAGALIPILGGGAAASIIVVGGRSRRP